MIDVLDTIKQAYDESTTQVDKIVFNGQEHRISNVQYYDDVYEEGNIFGTVIAKGLDFEIENTMDLEGQEIEYLTGIMVDGITQWISLGNFIIQDVQPNDTTNIVKVTAMDYMLKTNIPYVSELNYADGTVTLTDVLQEVCTKSGLTLATTSFTNSTFIVDSNQFAEGTLNRQVIQAVAQISGTVAKVRNNQLYLINPNTITEVSKIFTLNSYEEAEIKRATHPINLVSLGMVDVEGENITLRDETSIEEDGENSLIINDNPFAYTQAKREQLITALFDAIKGFEYKSYSFKCQGLPYLETLDKIQFIDKEKNTYDSYVFRFNYKSPNGLESTIEAPSITKATVAYQNIPDALEIAKRTEIIVDKQNQKIESVISNVTEQNNKISQVTQTVDELNSKIQDIADITTFGESMYAKVELDSINESEPIQITVKPTVENISYLYPHENLFPSDDLYLKDRKIRFTNKTDNTYIDYILPDDLLIAPDGTYDEFYLGYDEQVCQITKRCQYNADGTVSKLEQEQIISYNYPKIELKDGDYTIELLGYANAYLNVRMMAQNIYTTQFATKAEVKSEISQKADEVNISVDKKLSNYSTTTQMNAAINAKANEINLEVGKKVNNEDFTGANFMLGINNDTSSAVIKADKVSLSGKKIDLTSDNISITSNNFNVDSEGNVSCNNANIKGTVESSDGNIGGWTINNEGLTNGRVFVKNDGSSTIYTVADLIVIRGFITGRDGFELSEAMKRHYDLNGDGEVTAVDYQLLQNLIGIRMN